MPDPITQLQAEVNKALHKAGFTLVSDIRKNLNTPQPYRRTGASFRGFGPSQPGQFPRKLSGQLLKSIAFVVDEVRSVLTVGTSMRYGAWLELGTRHMSPRPWLLRTYEQSKDKIAKFFGGK